MKAKRYGTFRFKPGTPLRVLTAAFAEVVHQLGSELPVVDVKVRRTADELSIVLESE